MDTVKIEVTETKNPLRVQRFRWRIRHQNGQIIATSGEFFHSRRHAHVMARKLVIGAYALVEGGQ